MTEPASSWRLPLRSMLPLLAALLLLPAIIAFLLASMSPELYRGEADVYHRVENPEYAITDRLLATQEVRAQQRDLVAEVAAEHGVTTDYLASHLTVDMLDTGLNEDSTTLRFHVTHEDPETARALTQGMVDAYLEDYGLVDQLPGFEENEKRAEELEELLEDLRGQIADAVEAGDHELEDELEEEYDFRQKDLGLALDLWGKLRPSEPLVYTEKSTTAWVTTEPVEPRPGRTALLGLAAGIVLAGAALVILRRPGEPIID